MLFFNTVGETLNCIILYANLAALVGLVLRIETGGFDFDGTVNRFPSDILPAREKPPSF